MGWPSIRAWCCWTALGLALACGPGGTEGPLQATLDPPASALPTPGSQVVFQVTTQGGDRPPSFQWFKNNQPIPGATSATLLLRPVTSLDAGSYQVQVTDGVTSLETEPFDLEPVDDSWVVTSAADSGPGTLRDILSQANTFPGVNGIQFGLPGPGPYTITLQSMLPAITGNICILGPYQSPLTLDGGGACRPLLLNGGTLVLDNFTVAHGLGKGGDGLGGGGGGAGMGGALFMNAGSLNLIRMTFQSNQAVGGSSFPGSDGENGGGGGFGGDSPTAGGVGASGGLLGGNGGPGFLDGSGFGGAGTGGSGGSGGGATRGGPLDTPPDQVATAWAGGKDGGDGSFGGGGGFGVGPLALGGGSRFGGGGGGSGGSFLLTGSLRPTVLPGAGPGEAGWGGGDGGQGDGILPGLGGGGGGMGGAIFLRAGTLAMSRCSFNDNHAVPGTGDENGGLLQALALGKGGAVFIDTYDEASKNALYLNVLQAQTYSSNTATDLVEPSVLDNNDYYVPEGDLPGIMRGSPLGLLYQRYQQARKLGLPWTQ